MNTFISKLGPTMSAFLDYKHALGIKYAAAATYLSELDRYNAARGDHHTLVKEVVDGWALEHAQKSTTTDRSWVSPIREFGRYLVISGDSDAYVLDNSFIIQRYHPDVYLMTETEIQRFFNECDHYVLRHKALGRAYVFPALYRFMYCCGVRSAEARQFLSEELTQYLIDYNAAIRKIFPEREYFFPGGHGGICSSTALSVNFKNIWLAAGLKRDGKVKPRAYDFRHHFACANIMRWLSEGKDIHAMLPYLMRYMGHSSLDSTYYYIHLIPDFFPQYRCMTASTEELIPEVDADEV